MKARRKRRRRRTREEIEALLGRYHKSGMTVLEFSAAEGVTDSSLYKWLREERAGREGPTLMELSPPASAGEHFVIGTPGGYRVEVPALFSTEALGRVLGVLER